MTGTSPGFRFKVMTVNIHKGFTLFNRRFMLHDLRHAVRTVGAEVVFLQEVLGAHANRTHHSAAASAPHYEFLADTIWPEFAYGRNAVTPTGHHGNALLSKFPIRRHQNRDVSVGAPERRGLLHCVLQVPGRGLELHAVCVHLGLKEAHRRRQLELLCRMIADEVPGEAPLVVAGDFNDWRVRAHSVLRHCAGLNEVFASANGQAARTFPARVPLLRLDRIYVRNAAVHRPVVLPRRPWTHLSDHAPLVAEVTL